MAPDLTPPGDLREQARLSARFGSDPLLIQAAGRNTSAKEGDVMWIKASAGTLPAEAESRGEGISLDDYARPLEGLAGRSVSAPGTDPDITTLNEHGPAFGGDRIAQFYRDLGGEADKLGKPHPLICHVASDRFGALDPARVLHIGESAAHDIRGTHSAGCSATPVRTGIHADEPLDRALATAPRRDRPDFVIALFAS